MVMPGVCLQIDQELADPAVPVVLLRRPGAAEQDHVVGQMRVAGPDLGAVDHVAALHLAHRAGAHRGEIGADVGLAHADAEEAFAGGDARQDRLLLLLGADAQDRGAGLAVGDPVRADRGAGGQHFLQHHVAFERGCVRARHSRFGQVMPIQPRLPIARENAVSWPVQLSRALQRLAGRRARSARKARTSARSVSASGEGGGGGKAKAADIVSPGAWRLGRAA